jgi:hypothetical protein
MILVSEWQILHSRSGQTAEKPAIRLITLAFEE